MSGRRGLLFGSFVLIAFGISANEVANEWWEGEAFSDMADDVAMLCLSLLMVVFFVFEWITQQRAVQRLSEQLDRARGQLAERDADSARISGEYRQVLTKQFTTWQLTPSEQDVVLALLKGLSFKEIAQLRDTREKTVRQHAAHVYRKAGVAGRHELAAWFFEDLLGPTTAPANPDSSTA